jgi:DNA-binding NarL/FixJ family response regulator
VQRDDVRSAVRLFVQQEPGVQVVDEAVSVQTLLRSARRLRGDLIVADTALPGMLDTPSSSATYAPAVPDRGLYC